MCDDDNGDDNDDDDDDDTDEYLTSTVSNQTPQNLSA